MTTHIERTNSAPRQSGVHPVVLSRVTKITPAVRLLTLALPYTIKFLPGQWVDLHIPSLSSPGGFTVVSSPSNAVKSHPPPTEPPATILPREKTSLSETLAKLQFSKDDSSTSSRPFIELAVQRTSNPPAQWLWQPADDILGSTLGLRIGGSFTWPPPDIDPNDIQKVIFVAGGVGINPFISMLTAIYEHPEIMPRNIELLYSTKGGSHLQDALFLNRLLQLFETNRPRSVARSMNLHITGDLCPEVIGLIGKDLSDATHLHRGRVSAQDLSQAIRRVNIDKDGKAVAYVCGPGGFVDSMVKLLSEELGADSVFFEKWW